MDDMLKPRTEWQRLFAFVRPTWKQWAGLTISLLLSAGLGAVPPLLVRDIIDRALPNSDHRLLLLLAAAMILASVGAGMIGLWRDALVKEIGEQKMLDLRGRLFERSLYRSLHFFTSSDAGEVLSRLQNDVAGVRTVVNGLVVTIAFNFIQIITILSMLLYMNAGLAVIAIVALPLFIVPARRVGTKTQELTHETHIEMSRLTGLAQEMLSVSGWLLLRLFGAQRYASKSFHARSQRLCDLSVQASRTTRVFMLWVSLFWSAVPVVFYIVGGLAVLDGRATIGTVVAFVGYSALLFGPVVGVVDGYLEVRRSLVPLNRIFEYLDAAEVRAETQSTSPTEPGITGDIRFEDVSYVYKDGTKAVDAVSFEVRAGQTVAVVGRSGSGKTTLAYLISRIYEPTSGTVMLDRMDTRRLSLQTLTESISMVTQEAALFNCSIEENLRYAKPDATDLELRRVCRAVHLEELIAKLPDGLATRIGDRGFRFSGGERQRLAIARILLRDPRVLIFDEATSALDRQSEYHLQQALSNALQGRTKFVIAHRLATIANADLVLVLEHGAIVSRGKLGDLVKRRDPALLRLFSDELSGGSQSVEAVFGVSS